MILIIAAAEKIGEHLCSSTKARERETPFDLLPRSQYHRLGVDCSLKVDYSMKDGGWPDLPLLVEK